MIYVISDMKRLLKNKMVQTCLWVMLILSIAVPVSTYLSSTPDHIGAQPFQWWLLMGQDFAGQIYRILFLVSFIGFVLILGMNLVVTHICFSTSAPISQQYEYLIPNIGTFGDFSIRSIL